MEYLYIEKVSDNFIMPERCSEYAAGYDLSSPDNHVLPSKGKKLIPLNFKIQIPIGYYGRIAPRSGIALKNFIDVGAGVIDCDYRGNVGVLLFNFSDTDFHIQRGDRIAQLIIEKIITPDIIIVNKLNESIRGENGFGHTGIGERK
jgi:dUTP pyrophosphatase